MPGRFPAEAEDEVVAQIDAELTRDTPRYAYGSLASGADILWAEALLAHGAELHVVLPFAREAFIDSSVASSGPGWVARFQRCLGAAASVIYATENAFVPDDALYRYGSELAMGLALLRARYLDADVRQLAVWDGAGDLGEAGTARDIATWRATGLGVSVIAPGPAVAPAAPATEASGRVVRAMLFADVKGFSKLADEQVPRVLQAVLGAFAAVLERYAHAIEHQNTWGDALYVVLTDPVAAAECALELQGAMAELDLRGLGLEDQLALRIGVHVGPVFPLEEPVLRTRAFTGSHVSRTARIEPVTPPGHRVRDGAVRRGPRARLAQDARLRLRRHHARREGLRPLQDVPPAAAARSDRLIDATGRMSRRRALPCRAVRRRPARAE